MRRRCRQYQLWAQDFWFHCQSLHRSWSPCHGWNLWWAFTCFAFLVCPPLNWWIESEELLMTCIYHEGLQYGLSLPEFVNVAPEAVAEKLDLTLMPKTLEAAISAFEKDQIFGMQFRNGGIPLTHNLTTQISFLKPLHTLCLYSSCSCQHSYQFYLFVSRVLIWIYEVCACNTNTLKL